MKTSTHHKSTQTPLGIIILIVGVLSMAAVIAVCSFTLHFGSMSFLKDANADTEYVTVEEYDVNPPIIADLAASSEPTGFIDPAAGSANDLYINVSQYSMLEFGDDSPAVSALHLRLMELGYMDYDEVSSLYNLSTENAVKLFQRSNDLAQTGVATAELQELLFEAGAQEYRAKANDNGIDIRDVQERLNELGYYNDKISGYYGPQTEMAVRLFQSKNNFSIDGEISRDEYSVLYSDDAVAIESDLVDLAIAPADKPSGVGNENSSIVHSISIQSASKTPKPTKTPTPKATATVKVYTRPTSAQKKKAQSGYVSSGNVNMRSGPGTNYSIIKKDISKDTIITLYELQGSWWFVKCGSSYGYLHKNLVKTGTPKATSTPKPTSTPTLKPTKTPTAKPASTPSPKVTNAPSPKVTKTPTPKATAKATATATVYTKPTAAQIEKAQYGYASSGNINMRSGPGTNYSIIKKDIPKDTVLILYEQQGSWWFVKCDSDYGYIYKDLVKAGTPKATATPKPTKTPTPKATVKAAATSTVYTRPTSAQIEKAKPGYVTSGNNNMRSGPGTSYSVIKKDIPGNTIVTLYEQQGSWWFLKCGSIYGYIHKDLIKTGTPKPTPTPKPTKTPTPKATKAPTQKPEKTDYGTGISGMIACAEAQLGDPYVKGGKGPDSFDCSGLVYYCLKSAGLSVSRTSAKNYSTHKSWKKIEKISDLKRGDLIFWCSDSSSNVSHVGICTGGGNFIHASSSKGEVCRSSFGSSSSYWVRNFVCGRRPFS